MKPYIALLRGINVGGHRKVPMAELRALLTKRGFHNVQTYIQSGNLILKSDLNSNEKIQEVIQKLIHKTFGFEVTTLVKSPNELQTIFDDCPFDNDEKEKSYFAILSEIPHDDLVKIASEKTFENDVYHIINNCIYLYPKLGFGKSKFNLKYFEKKLQVSATTRNHKTMLKLLSMVSES